MVTNEYFTMYMCQSIGHCCQSQNINVRELNFIQKCQKSQQTSPKWLCLLRAIILSRIAWEWSLNPSSTASMVDVGFIFLPPPFTAHRPSFPNMAIHPQAPLPSPEGCGPITLTLNSGKHRGREEQ